MSTRSFLPFSVGVFLVLCGIFCFDPVDSRTVVTTQYNASLDRWYSGTVSFETSITFNFDYTIDPNRTRALRLQVDSRNASPKRPLMVVVRESKTVTSWEVPLSLEKKYKYWRVRRTLCPAQDHLDFLRENSNDTVSQEQHISIDITTQSRRPVDYSFNLWFVSGFMLQTNKQIDFRISPSAPAFFQYTMPDDVDRVLVRSWAPSEEKICTVMSVQPAICPVGALPTEVTSQGEFQTFTTSGAILVKKKDFVNGKFDVVLVPLSDDRRCNKMAGLTPQLTRELEELEAAINANNSEFNDTRMFELRQKQVFLAVENVLKPMQYAVATGSVLAFYFCFYLIFRVALCFGFMTKRTVNVPEQSPTKEEPEINDKFEDKDKMEYIDHDVEKGNNIKLVHFKETTSSSDLQQRALANGDGLPKYEFAVNHDRPDLLPLHESTSTGKKSPTAGKKSPTSGKKSPVSDKKSPTGDKRSSGSDKGSPASQRSLRDGLGKAALYKKEQTSQSQATHDGVEIGDEFPKTEETLGEKLDRTEEEIQEMPTYQEIQESEETRAAYRASLAGKDTVMVTEVSLKPMVMLFKADRAYNWTLLIIAIFYALPVIQLVITYQKFMENSGNMDMCWYNFKCAHPLGPIKDFNHVYSNIGYVLLGMLFVLIVRKRQNAHFKHEAVVEEDDDLQVVGLPPQYGLFYAMGFSLIMEGIMSACYHVCPNLMNFQFDTAFMYLLGGLFLLKVYQSRHADISPNAQMAYAVFALWIFIAVLGVVIGKDWFWWTFAVILIIASIPIGIQVYYMGSWKFDLGVLRRAWRVITCRAGEGMGCERPTATDRFSLLILIYAVNWIMALGGAIFVPTDFSTFLLVVVLANAFLYFLFYTFMKVRSGERISKTSQFFMALAGATWAGAIYFFLFRLTNWLSTPAVSREGNESCFFLEFYDQHDVWHLMSACSMFFNFMILFTLDDDLFAVPRRDIRVF
ncbi:sid-1b [Ramazzottius varieornatus]|uniref:Sid-1b n=1 Tax=Ramazzottius varieornatus TaxID=947166 RepID=A0A1D1VNI7_RAMVA|nr:sid-1b [Ramazzottius varieornatus]